MKRFYKNMSDTKAVRAESQVSPFQYIPLKLFVWNSVSRDHLEEYTTWLKASDKTSSSGMGLSVNM